MRFISQYPSYGIQIRPQRVRPLGDGTSQTLQEPLYIKFIPADEGGMIYEKEQYEASKRFDFHGSQQHQDEATPVDTIHRLGSSTRSRRRSGTAGRRRSWPRWSGC